MWLAAARLRSKSSMRFLSLEQVQGLPDVGDAEVRRQRRIALGDSFEHGVSDIAVREMSGGRGAQLGNVEGFGEIHFEERALTIGQRQSV